MLLRHGEEALPKRSTSADGVLPQTRLRLVNPQRHVAARRQAVVFDRQSLVVQAVAGFVQDAEKRHGKVMLVVPRRDPAVVRAHAAAERMMGHVQPPASKVEPDRLRHQLAERFLSGHRIPATEQFAPRLAAAADQCSDQRRQLVPQSGQYAGHVGRPRQRLEIIQQCVVGLVRITGRLGLLAFQLKDLFQVRTKESKVVILAGFGPGLLAQHASPRQLLDQRLRQLAAFFVVSPQLAKRRAGRTVRIGVQPTAGQFAQPRADLRVGAAAMHQSGQVRDLLGAVLARRRRQHRPFVPAEQFLDRFDQRRLTNENTQLIVHDRQRGVHPRLLEVAYEPTRQRISESRLYPHGL